MRAHAGLLVLVLACATGAWAEVDVNRANRAQLEQLRGIGPPLADAILAEREARGAFKDWAELITRVRGIRAPRAAKLSDAGLRVAGAPYLPAMPSNSTSK